MAAGRWRQLILLVWKNWLFSIRSWKSTLLQLFAPCFFLLLVTAVSYLPPALEDVPRPPVETVGNLPKCYGWNKRGCRSLVAFNINYKEFPTFPPDPNAPPSIAECINTLMEEFSNRSGLTKGSDLNGNTDILVLNEVISSALFLKNSSAVFDNETQVAVGFLECNLSSTAPKLNYTILFNSSRALKFQQLIFGSPNKPDGRVEVASMLDSIFLNKVLGKSVHVNISTSTFPMFYQQQSVQSRQATSSTEFVFCAITFQFVMMMYNVVSEKDLKLRQGLKLIGLKDSIYWFAWAITGVVISFLSTCVLMITGYACQLQFFLNTNFLINFLLFLLYSCSMVPLAFFASVFISTVRQAVNTGMVVFVVGLLVISLLANPFLLTELYEYVRPFVLVLGFLPPFHLAKIMADIGIAASDTDMNGLPQTPYHFGWHDLFIKRPVLTFDFSTDPTQAPSSSTFYMPPTYLSYLGLVFNLVFYSVLAWYLDAVFPGNHGIPRKWYFPFKLSYWFDWLIYTSDPKERLQVRIPTPDIQNNNDHEERDGDTLTEETALLQKNRGYGSQGYALRIEGLKKSFKSGSCCFRRLNKPAVDGLSLCTAEHQILALLGHNGAGKTTTINMLIGLLSPDQGDAYFYNLSVRENLDAIRSFLGVCPQHDILWGDLTAREHMQLFGTLKDIPKDQLQAEIEKLLEDVNLSRVANHRVKTFSGGMKRRLSVALSFLGDPRVIFLDEPTTGMDPKIRRDVWNLILRMKQNRVMIMTTHSMEEADILGDTIAIMANGQLKVMGTSVNLKNRYAGYNIELVVRQEDVQQLMAFVEKQLPGATPKSEPIEVEGGVLVPYNLSPDRNAEIVPFFKVIESDQTMKRMILDYSISQTTLEEVFLNVTVNELFQDVTYQPVLFRAHSFSPISPVSVTDSNRLSPLPVPFSKDDSVKVDPKTFHT